MKEKKTPTVPRTRFFSSSSRPAQLHMLLARPEGRREKNNTVGECAKALSKGWTGPSLFFYLFLPVQPLSAGRTPFLLPRFAVTVLNQPCAGAEGEGRAAHWLMDCEEEEKKKESTFLWTLDRHSKIMKENSCRSLVSKERKLDSPGPNLWTNKK